jgi:hypothetical protein
MNINDNACLLDNRVALRPIASKLATTNLTPLQSNTDNVQIKLSTSAKVARGMSSPGILEEPDRL